MYGREGGGRGVGDGRPSVQAAGREIPDHRPHKLLLASEEAGSRRHIEIQQIGREREVTTSRLLHPAILGHRDRRREPVAPAGKLIERGLIGGWIIGNDLGDMAGT